MRAGMENSSSWKKSPGLKFCNTASLSSSLSNKLYNIPSHTSTFCNTLAKGSTTIKKSLFIWALPK